MLRVIGGNLKKRIIPFQNKKFGYADVTPHKIKGALFSIIGENLSNRSFLDLYACSGQIGIEAISRDAQLVVMNEIDASRFDFIKSLVGAWNLEEKTIVLNLHSFQCLRYLSSRGYLFDFIFIDPPYVKTGGESGLYSEIFTVLEKNLTLKGDGTVIVQHFSENRLRDEYGKFILSDTKKYGNNSLSLFRMACGDS